MTMPAEKWCARARKATAGVVMTPADSTVAPPAVRPAVRVAAIQSEDSRVSWPMMTRGAEVGIVGREVVREGEADGVDGGGVEWGLAGDGADAVGAE